MITFQQMEVDDGVMHNERSSLGDWYQSIRMLPIGELSVGDLARAVRQKLFLRVIILEVFKRLLEDPLAGEQFDGELIASLGSLTSADWGELDVVRADVGLLWNDIIKTLERMDIEEDILLDARKVTVALIEKK